MLYSKDMRSRTVAASVSVALLGVWQDAAGQGQCALAGPAPVAPSACVSCHGSAPHAHPVDIDYAEAQRRSGSLRPLAAVVARGVNLPEGRVQCVTCHDARSPWAKWIALPPNAVARRADESRGENASNWRVPPKEPSPELPRGTEVSVAQLCAACHTFAD